MLFFVVSKGVKLWRPCRMNNFMEAHTFTSFTSFSFAETAQYVTSTILLRKQRILPYIEKRMNQRRKRGKSSLLGLLTTYIQWISFCNRDDESFFAAIYSKAI
jgi:hypothetical protein